MNSEKRRTVFFRAFWRIVILLFVMIPLLWGVRTSLCASNYDKLIPKGIYPGQLQQSAEKSFVPAWHFGTASWFRFARFDFAADCYSSVLRIRRMKFKGRFFGKSASPLPLLPAIAVLIPLVQNMNAIGLL